MIRRKYLCWCCVINYNGFNSWLECASTHLLALVSLTPWETGLPKRDHVIAWQFSVSTSYHVTCFREASTGESAAAVSIYLWANTHSERNFIIIVIIMASPADKSVCWTNYLTKLPKFSILDISNYLNIWKRKAWK